MNHTRALNCSEVVNLRHVIPVVRMPQHIQWAEVTCVRLTHKSLCGRNLKKFSSFEFLLEMTDFGIYIKIMMKWINTKFGNIFLAIGPRPLERQYHYLKFVAFAISKTETSKNLIAFSWFWTFLLMSIFRLLKDNLNVLALTYHVR